MSWFPQMVYLGITAANALPLKAIRSTPVGDAEATESFAHWYAFAVGFTLLLMALAGAGGFYAHGLHWPQFIWTAGAIIQLGRALMRPRPTAAYLNKPHSMLATWALVAADLVLLTAGGFFHFAGVTA